MGSVLKNTLSSGAIQNVSGVAAFSIANSFLLDGVNENFTVPLAALNSTLTGTSKKWTINVGFRPQTLGATDYVFSDDGFKVTLRTDTNSKLQMIVKTDDLFKSAVSTTAMNVANWSFYTIVYDYSLTLGNRLKIYLNGVDDTASDNTTDGPITAATGDWEVCSKASAAYFNCYFQQISVLDIALSSAQALSLYNSGSPLSAQTEHGANCKWLFNADNSGATAQFTVADATNSIDATSVNLEDADKTTETPY